MPSNTTMGKNSALSIKETGSINLSCVIIFLSLMILLFQALCQWAGRLKKRERDKQGLGLTESLEQVIMIIINYYALPRDHYRNLQLSHIPVVAFSQTEVFLL